MSQPKLLSILTPSVVTELAGPRSYARGVGYHHDDRVELGGVSVDRAEAMVLGAMPYDVVLGIVEAELHWSCSCPVGEDGDFCKHCVAVALALIESGAGEATATTEPTRATGSKRGRSRKPEATARPKVDLRTYVESLDASELVDLVMEQADGDWRLRERLLASAAAEAGAEIDERTWRRRLDAVFAPYGDFISYREAGGWAGEVNDVIDSLEELVDARHAAAVVVLAEHAHRNADAAIGYMDDSDGWLSDISFRLGQLHQRACRVARPDPVELARRLVALELTSELDAFHRAAASYTDVLGETGNAEYRSIVEPKWRAAGPRSDQWSTERFRLREAMTGVALAGGNPDDLIKVKQDDLRTPEAYGEIAEALRSAGRIDDAIDWARRGLDSHADRTWQTPPLRELLAGMLRDRGDTAGAIDVFWAAFERQPSLDAYRRLLSEAERSGRSDELRDRSLATLQGRVAEGRPEDASSRSIVASTPVAAHIDILLYDGDPDAAWDVAAEHGASDRQWMALARARESSHPLDALAVYEREIAAQIDTKKNQGYSRAVELLARSRELANQAGEPERFVALLAEVRTRHKPKRNLMALLAKKGW